MSASGYTFDKLLTESKSKLTAETIKTRLAEIAPRSGLGPQYFCVSVSRAMIRVNVTRRYDADSNAFVITHNVFLSLDNAMSAGQ